MPCARAQPRDTSALSLPSPWASVFRGFGKCNSGASFSVSTQPEGEERSWSWSWSSVASDLINHACIKKPPYNPESTELGEPAGGGPALAGKNGAL